LYAVASRSIERAESFQREYGFEKAFGSYDEMLADPALDAVYIATTNNLHCHQTLLCIEAGKAVLCEKPLAMNRHEAEEMVAKAREKGVFLMQAIATRFLPNVLNLKAQVQNGCIGKPVMLQCDFGFYKPFAPDDRVYAPALGGGSVPDIGIYPVFIAMYLFGKPVEIKAMSVAAPTGTDRTTTVLLRHAEGELSVLSSSFQTLLNNEARVYGENGMLKIPRQFSLCDRLLYIAPDGAETTLTAELQANGYNYEAAELMRCLDNNLTESPALTHRFSIDLIDTLDAITATAAS